MKEWVKKTKEIRRKKEVWEIVNRERRRGRKINQGIEMEIWKEYFMRLMGGVEGRVVRGGGRIEEDGEGQISREIREAVDSLKDGKAAGIDEVPSEV